MEPIAVSVQRAAEMIDVSPFTIRKYVRLGKLRSVRVGRRVLVPVEALQDLIAAKVVIEDAAVREDSVVLH